MSIHLGIDAVGTVHSGGATILIDVLRTAAKDDRLSHITVFTSPRARRDFELPEVQKIAEMENAKAGLSYFHRILWFELGMGRVCQRLKVDVLLCLSGMGRTSSRVTPHVTYIQQSLPFSKQAIDRCSPAFRYRVRLIRQLMRHSCRTSARIVTQTPTMLNWVASAFKLEKERLVWFLPPVQPLPAPSEAAHSGLERMQAVPADRRILYVGNLDAYKNLEVAVQGMRHLRLKMPGATLFLTASPDHPLCQAEGVAGLGYLDKASLSKTYRLASLLIQPSLVESATLPPAEGMLAGTSVLVSDLPYAHDMCEDAAIYFDPLNALDFAEKALMILQDGAMRQACVQRGKEIMARRQENNSYYQLLDLLVEVAAHKTRI